MKDFIGFRFGNVHTKDLNLVVVTSSDRYEKNLLPNPKDYTVEIPGGDGQYYFGQTFDSREFNCDVAFDSVDEATWRKISQLFATDKLQDLVFDELPYKTYRAKLKSKPEFKFICFTDRDTGERVYKGEGTLNFICYFPYAFGFNKYIVRAADYYLNTPPETIIKTHSKAEHEYAKNLIEPLDKHTKDFYNVENNMNTPWKSGYPTFEQVQAGELFFNTPNGEKSIIDVRGYWENVPEWAPSSKLLTTPTLDYDQELIYLPQYCKTSYMNMDTGLTIKNAVIGSRLLVYNPGDLPVDFKMDFNANQRSFWTSRGNHFQIRRFNVQRLTIPQAVDWTGLKPQNVNDEEAYKYGNKYFKIKSKSKNKGTDKNGNIIYGITYNDLDDRHPNHAYIAEPIPRQLLGNFIRTFYMQSAHLRDKNFQPLLKFEDGLALAERYEELYSLCNSEVEEYELYWETLKKLLENYKDHDVFDESKIITALKLQNSDVYVYFENGYPYIANKECLTNEKPAANEIVFDKLVNFIDRKNGKFSYELIANENPVSFSDLYAEQIAKEGKSGEKIIFKDIITKKCYRIYTEHKKVYFERFFRRPDTEPETLEKFIYDYIHNPPEFIRKEDDTNYGEVVFNKKTFPQWYTPDYLEILSEGMKDNEIKVETEKMLVYSEYYNREENIFNYNGNYKPNKIIYNDNVIQGHWFKLPPGWSLIEVAPVCSPDYWGGKTWGDARAFDWGYGGDENHDKKKIQEVFDAVYDDTVDLYLTSLGFTEEDLNDEEEGRDTFMNFRLWYMDEIERYYSSGDKFGYEYFKNKETQLEYGFLQALQDGWNIQENEEYGITGYIGEWWWYACNYIWANFPPLYWGLADILTDAKVDYIPLFY